MVLLNNLQRQWLIYIPSTCTDLIKTFALAVDIVGFIAAIYFFINYLSFGISIVRIESAVPIVFTHILRHLFTIVLY